MAGTISADRNNGQQSTILGILAAPFIAFGRLMVMIAEANPRMRELDRLNQITDEELEAKGLTRASEIQRILGVNASL